jgi:hypothetical protein
VNEAVPDVVPPDVVTDTVPVPDVVADDGAVAVAVPDSVVEPPESTDTEPDPTGLDTETETAGAVVVVVVAFFFWCPTWVDPLALVRVPASDTSTWAGLAAGPPVPIIAAAPAMPLLRVTATVAASALWCLIMVRSP